MTNFRCAKLRWGSVGELFVSRLSHCYDGVPNRPFVEAAKIETIPLMSDCLSSDSGACSLSRHKTGELRFKVSNGG